MLFNCEVIFNIFNPYKATFLMSKFRLKCHIARSEAREKLMFQGIYPQIAGAAEKNRQNQKGKKVKSVFFVSRDFPVFATL